MKKLLLFGALTFGLNAFGQVPSYVPSTGLESWWPFDGNANDESGNGNNGTVTGSALTLDRFGQSNSAYNFNGVNNYINMINPGPLGNADRSISFWARTNGTGEMVPFDYGDANGAGGTFQIQYNNACAGVGLDVSNGVVTKSNNSVLDNNWHHCVIILDQNAGTNVNNVVVYVDNVLFSPVTCGALNQNQPVNTANNVPITIGSTTLNTSRFFNGDIDDIGVWNRVLSQQEISDLYNGCSLSSSTLAVTQNGALLTADQAGATYQWLDCDNNYSIINGETNQSYTPALTGNYAVEVNMNGCIDTSECFLVDYTGIEEHIQSEKELVKVVDFMGRETEFKPNIPLIFIYSDGTRERVMKIEE